jgi:hypothetical protein
LQPRSTSWTNAPGGGDRAASRSRLLPSALVLGLLAAGLLAALVLRPVQGEHGIELTLFGVTLPVACAFRRITGLPCASCGLTRSLVLFLHGRIAESIALHPFGPVVLLLGLAQLPPRLATLRGREGPWSAAWDRMWVRGAIAVGVLLALWWLIRLGGSLSHSIPR